jgi:hypothetical protein
MKRCIIPFAAALAFTGAARADFNPVPLNPSSFNQDIIVERTGPSPVVLGAATSASMDQGIGNDGDTWNEQGFFLQDPNVGLPAAGSTFTSISLSDHSYQLAPSYTANDAVMLDQGYFSNTTVTVTTPRACAQLSFLTSGGNGGCTFQYVVHHADGSSETGTTQSPDWWNGANPAWMANGRSASMWFTLDNHNESGNPRLYSKDVTLSNQTSPVTSIDLSWSSGSGSGHSCVMAISANASAGAAFTPLPFTGYNADIVVEATAQRLWLSDYLAPPEYIPVTATDGGTNRNSTTLRLEGYAWFEQGYFPPDSTVGIPHPGNFTSQAQPDHHYTMPADYTVNNALYIDSDTTNGTITFATPAAYTALSLLGSSFGGGCTVDVTVNFNNSSSETHTIVIPDWFGNAPIAWNANGRVDVNWGTMEDINSGNPRLYSVDFALNDSVTPITSLTLTRTAGGRGHVFAVSASSGAVAPLITLQPASKTVSAGTSASFTTTVSGTAPITLQWQKGTNGLFVDLAGQNASGLTISQAGDADEADYRLIAANAAGSATSTVATLTVLSTLPAITFPTDPIAAYQPQGGSSPDTENVAHAIDGLTSKYLNFGNGATPLTVPVGFTVTPSIGRTFLKIIRFYTANDSPERDPANYIVEGSIDGGSSWTLIASNSLALPDARNNAGLSLDPLNQPMRQVRLDNQNSYSAYRVYFTRIKGNVNLMQIGEVEMLGTQDTAGYPVLTTSPTNSYTYVGRDVSLYAAATGAPAPTFQWLRNGQPIAGATDSTLAFVNPQFSDVADYRVVVANSLQTLTSQVARLTVFSTLPKITQPSDAIVAFNDGAGTHWGNDANPLNAIDGIFDNYRNGGTNENAVAGFPPFSGPVGLIITPAAGETLLTGIRIYTATAAPELDPADVEIFGSNDAGATWTPITSSALNLPQERNNAAYFVEPVDSFGHFNPVQEILFGNSHGYTSYKVQFTHTRNDSNANSLQIGEIELLGGAAVPLTFQALPGGQFQLSWSQGTLLEATDLRGPWTTNTASSPLTITPTGPQKFFRLQVQ